jgi:hypothetical protein
LLQKSAETPEQIAKTASALEQLLWKQAKQNIEVYSNGKLNILS